MDKKIIRKLILSSSMLGLTAISLVTSTFAFINLNTEAKVAEFGFNIKNQEGLLISTDGVNFSQDLNYTQITQAILKHYNEDLDNKVNDYDEVRFLPVTLKEDNGKVSYSSYNYQIGTTGVDLTDYKADFLKDTVVEADDTYKTAIGALDNDVYYKHNLVKADSSNYIFVDLWLTVATLGNEKASYDLKMSDRTAITGTINTVKLENKLTTTGALDERSGNRVSGANVGKPYIKGEYLADDEIEVNPADALRLAVVTPANDSTSKPTIKVYEPNLGLGSYAFNLADGNIPTELKDDNHNKDKNAAYTYYNSINTLSPFTEYNKDYANYFEGTVTKNTFTSSDDVYGTFTYNEATGAYNTIKLSVLVWLEGWDADYFVGVSTQDVMIKLGFVINKQE